MTTVAVPRARGTAAGRPGASSRRSSPIAALVWGTFNVVNLVAHSETRFTRTFPAAGIARVDVSTDRGSVRVIASDRDDVSLSAYVSNGLGGTDHAGAGARQPPARRRQLCGAGRVLVHRVVHAARAA